MAGNVSSSPAPRSRSQGISCNKTSSPLAELYIWEEKNQPLLKHHSKGSMSIFITLEKQTNKKRVVENYSNTFYSEMTWAMCERLRCSLYELILHTSLWLLGVLNWWPTQKVTPWSAPSEAAKPFREHQHTALNWLTGHSFTPSQPRTWMIIYRGDKRTQAHPLSFPILSKVVNQDACVHSTQGTWSYPSPNSIWT